MANQSNNVDLAMCMLVREMESKSAGRWRQLGLSEWTRYPFMRDSIDRSAGRA